MSLTTIFCIILFIGYMISAYVMSEEGGKAVRFILLVLIPMSAVILLLTK
jgi:TM2 domain-containing membrane protein YozV